MYKFFLIISNILALSFLTFDFSYAQEKTKTQEVVVEGVGTSSDLALKDAFRNAVSQVVGTLVDAETLVKNDKLVEDKILTYSNGFIKTYTEVEGSKKVQSGIHRVKIKATVVTGTVIEKLKAANITLKEVDGKGLFAEAMSKLESEKDAGALIAKHMKDFPQSCMKATVVGAPQIVEKGQDKIKAKFIIKVEPDLQAYKTFATGLTQVLDKAAFHKGQFIVYFQNSYRREEPKYVRINSDDTITISGPKMGLNQEKRVIPGYSGNPYIVARTLFEQFKKPNGTIFIVGSGRNELGTNCSYKYYFLDTPLGYRKNRDINLIKLTLLDDKEELLFSEEKKTFSLLTCHSDRNRDEYNVTTFSIDNLFRFDIEEECHYTFYTFEILVELTPEELKKTKTAKVEILPSN